MKKLLLCFLVFLVGSVGATPKFVPKSELKPDEFQRRTALVIGQVLESFHYTKPEINDELSAMAFDRYLETLDANRAFFTQVDIRQLDHYRDEFDDSLHNGLLDPAYTIFKHFRDKVENRIAFAVSLVRFNDFDFSLDETYHIDREKAPWATDDFVLDDLWRKRVKNDVLSLRLSGETKDIEKKLIRRYENIRNRVQQMTSADIFQAFVNAVTLSIEPHTTYMSPRSSENFDIGMRLSLQGIGAVLRGKDEYTEVVKTVIGGPAARSGKIKSGDRIVGVAQGDKGEMLDVIGWRLDDVVDKIRGPKGSTVRLQVLPKGEDSGRTKELALVRDQIKLEDSAAKSDVIEVDNLKLGVIEIPGFYRDFSGAASGTDDFRSTTRDVRELLTKLEAEKVNGIIIDLRQNGGGSLTEATELTGLFIDKGPVVQVKDSNGNVELERDQDPGIAYRGPLMVLVDRNSASASEIFAGAMQDYQRALIVGEPTFGKGTVQTLVDLQRYLRTEKDLGRLRLTMAQFFRVQGDSTQHRGVIPDVVFPTSFGAKEHGERALEHALPWASIEPAIRPRPTIFPIEKLRAISEQRIQQDPGFAFLIDQEKRIAELRDLKVLSLKESVRQAELDQREEEQLESLNRLRAYRGLGALESLDEQEELADQDKDPEGIKKIMLEEAARVMSDWIVNQPVIAASESQALFR